ncbi:MAG: choice-of-anchor D domain-containing protein [Candidatus Rokubacteria bacterium]|nr:choice-of-anchor D domain-containing protein [Candidatus Rokubacteria bacterium]
MMPHFLRAASLLFVALGVSSLAFAGHGSNLGSYGTNFSPAVLTGQVTSAGSPVAGARVSTIAGHSTATDATGNYTLHLDAPGIYTVTAQTATKTATGTVEVSLGQTFTLDLALAGGTAEKGKLVVSPKRVEFPLTNVGGMATRDLTIKNRGSGPLNGTVGALAGSFSVVSGGGGFTLAFDETKTVTVQFAPTAAGKFPDELKITSDDPRKPSLRVKVIGSAVSPRRPSPTGGRNK